MFSTTLRQDIPDLSHIVHDNLSFSFSLSFFVYVPLSTWCRASSEWWRPLLNPDPLMDFRSFRVRHFDFMSSTRETTTFIFCEHRWIFFFDPPDSFIHYEKYFYHKQINNDNNKIMPTNKSDFCIIVVNLQLLPSLLQLILLWLFPIDIKTSNERESNNKWPRLYTEILWEE